MSVIHESNEDSIVHDTSKLLNETSQKDNPLHYESHQEINIMAIDAEILLLSM